MLNIIRNKIIRILKALGASGITKIVLIIILLVFMTLVYASSNAKNISLETFEETLKSKSNMAGMKKCTNRQLMQFMNLDYNSYDSFLYYRSKDAMSADELLIIKAYKKNDIPLVEDAVDARIASRIKTFEGYAPNQVNLLNNAVIYKKGRYLFYAVGKNADSYQEVFEDAV